MDHVRAETIQPAGKGPSHMRAAHMLLTGQLAGAEAQVRIDMLHIQRGTAALLEGAGMQHVCADQVAGRQNRLMLHICKQRDSSKWTLLYCTHNILTFGHSQALLLHLEHALDDQRRPDSLQDEPKGKSKCHWHVEERNGQGTIKERLHHSWDEQQPDG